MQAPNVKFITGYSTRRFLLLDLDGTTKEKAIALARLLIGNYHVGNCLVVRSSSHRELIYSLAVSRDQATPPFPIWREIDGNYHLIFGREIGYDQICTIIEALAGLGVLNKQYANIRNWRSDLTLRISPDNSTGKPRPQPDPVAFLFDMFDPVSDGIAEYWNCRQSVAGFYGIETPIYTMKAMTT